MLLWTIIFTLWQTPLLWIMRAIAFWAHNVYSANQMKWIGLYAPLCTCRLNWARRTWRSQAELAISRRLPTILFFYEWAGKKHFVSLKLECQSPRSPTFQAGSFNHCTRAPALSDNQDDPPTQSRQYHYFYFGFLICAYIMSTCPSTRIA